MVLKVVVFLCALTSALLQSDKGSKLEPIESINLHIPTLSPSSIWTSFHEVDAKQAGVMTSMLKKGVRRYQSKNPRASIIISKGERVIVEKLSPGVKLNTLFELPYSNYLSILSVSLVILLENHNPSRIHGPMGAALKDKDLKNPIFTTHKEKSLYDILRTLPTPYGAESIKNSDTLGDLNGIGKVVLSYVNSILGDTMSEAWMDALFALGIQTLSVTEAGQLKVSLHHLLHFTLSMMHELQSIEEALSVDVLPNVDQLFMFGWWINCPRKLNVCLFPGLPEDLIISASPSLRLYISPSLEFSLAVLDNNATGIASLSDIANTDEALWAAIRSSLRSVGGSSDRFSAPDTPESNKLTGESNDSMIHLLKIFYPILFFLFWVLAVHGLVYCTLHLCWFIAVGLSKETHEARPKTATKLH